MRLRNKKVFAREFLLIVVTFALTVSCYLSIYLYNFNHRHRIENIEKSITAQTKVLDSLQHLYWSKSQKQQWLFDKFFELTHSNVYTKQTLWRRLNELAKNDSIKTKWTKIWSKDIKALWKEIGFDNPDTLSHFALFNEITPFDSANYQQSLHFKNKINSFKAEQMQIENQILSPKAQLEFSKNCLLVLVLSVFGLRYLFYSVQWSFKTLKQRE